MQSGRSTRSAAWQASNKVLEKIISDRRRRRVPGVEARKLDCPWSLISKKIILDVGNTAQWIDMIGPIGIYYIHATDIRDTYKDAFSGLLWWMFKLRQRQTFKDMLVDDDESEVYTYVKWGRDRLATLEYLMPVHFLRHTVHLMQHVPEFLRLTGPVYTTWMMKYERYIGLAKGTMHSSKSAAKGFMSNMMMHEWRISRSMSTSNDLRSLMTPPLSHFPHRVRIQLLGASTQTRLHFDRDDKYSDFRLICNYLLTNDPVMRIINHEFERTHPDTSRRGTLLIYDWNIQAPSYATIIAKIKEETNVNVDAQDIDTMIRGPVGGIRRHKKVTVNDVSFDCHNHERANSRVTRKFIYFKMPDDGSSGDLDDDDDVNPRRQRQSSSIWNNREVERDRVVGQIESIYEVVSHDVSRLAKVYTLLRVTSYKYLQEHASGIPHVQPLSDRQSVYTMPIIPAQDVLPVNIALWPASLNAHQSFLVVHTDPFFGE
jgi:hypothetical protein